jgi:hypothetical protein
MTAAGYWFEELASDLLFPAPFATLHPALREAGIDDLEAFVSWLFPVVAEYRARCQRAESLPSFAQQRNELQAFSTALDQVAAALRNGLPPHFAPVIDLVMIRDLGAGHWPELRPQLREGVMLLAEAVHHVLSQTSQAQTSPGRPADLARHRLLARVTQEVRARATVRDRQGEPVQLKQSAARAAARAILKAVGIEAPAHDDALKRAVSQGQLRCTCSEPWRLGHKAFEHDPDHCDLGKLDVLDLQPARAANPAEGRTLHLDRSGDDRQ